MQAVYINAVASFRCQICKYEIIGNERLACPCNVACYYSPEIKRPAGTKNRGWTMTDTKRPN